MISNIHSLHNQVVSVPAFSGVGVPLGTAPHDSPATGTAIHQTSLKRRMVAELESMKPALSSWTHNDELTCFIREWHEKFTYHLNHSETDQQCCQNFLDLLNRALIDDIRQAPLDEEAYLGKDGRTYGKKTLTLHLDKEKSCAYAPLEEHLLARFIVKWLRKHGGCLPVPEIEMEYANLIASGNIPAIPTQSVLQKQQRDSQLKEHIERIRQQQIAMMNRRGHVSLQTYQFQQIFEAQSRAKFETEIRPQLDSIREELAISRDEQNNFVRQLLIQDAVQLIPLQEAAIIQRKTLELLEHELMELKQENQKVVAGISEVKNRCNQLQQDIKALELALSKRKDSCFKSLLAVGSSIAVCVAISYLIPGTGVYVAPIKDGAKIAITL